MSPEDDQPWELREGFSVLPALAGTGWLPPLLVEESFTHEGAPPEMMDSLWAAGWRHFGAQFYRYSLHADGERFRLVQPLRVSLAQFTPSASQRRILRRNADVEVRFQPPTLDAVRHALFEQHKRRFTENVPPNLEAFLGPEPGKIPSAMVEVSAWLDGRLAAVSYLDLGREGASSVYGVFDPELTRRSLGIATMLWELDHARKHGCRYYYPGYAYHSPSSMDYKKQFAGTEWYDWRGHWLPLAPAGKE
jgi:arginyl-tRNA--protein-N-Asp/Glu arginylyltransferase